MATFIPVTPIDAVTARELPTEWVNVDRIDRIEPTPHGSRIHFSEELPLLVKETVMEMFTRTDDNSTLKGYTV